MSVPYEFLRRVWRRSRGQHFVSAKDFSTGEWHEYPVSGRLKLPADTDVYFAVNTFSDERLRTADATRRLACA